MRGSRLIVLFIVAAIALVVAWSAGAEEATTKEPIAKDRLVEVLGRVKEWAGAAAELRQAAGGLEPAEIVKRADRIRSSFDAVMVLIATTEPQAAYKQAAVLLALGAKGVELALWHYIYAGVANHAPSIEHGDTLLKAALGQLSAAEGLFAK